ncbi:MAG TPA: hypothetical protein VGX69_04215 [Solirubrobacteraceae bacterium]|nr:hypothetical protein [Solirubrobacteraceae bacterium]
METRTSTFRLRDRDQRELDRFAEEMICSRTDVVRIGLAALRRNPDLRAQIRADNVARAFLKSLRSQYGDNAVLELVDGADRPEWKLVGEPIDREVIDVHVERVGDRFVMDLIDPTSGIAIHNVMSWTDEEGSRHAVVPLNQLWVYSADGVSVEPPARQLYDGRTVVQVEEDDGEIRQFILDHKGNSRVLAPGELPAAAFHD